MKITGKVKRYELCEVAGDGEKRGGQKSSNAVQNRIQHDDDGKATRTTWTDAHHIACTDVRSRTIRDSRTGLRANAVVPTDPGRMSISYQSVLSSVSDGTDICDLEMSRGMQFQSQELVHEIKVNFPIPLLLTYED